MIFFLHPPIHLNETTMMGSTIWPTRRASSYQMISSWHCLLLLLLLALFLINFPAQAATVTTTGSSTSSSKSTKSSTATTRTGYLDKFNVETLEYYLSGPTASYDVVVLFYATWDTNSRALLPIYERLGELLQAGTTASRLILAIFDCEKSRDHATACTTAGIEYYPTIQFYDLSSSSSSPSTSLSAEQSSSSQLPSSSSSSSKSNRRRPPRHVSIFQGNWQYGESILDWIRTLSFLSRWKRAQWGRRFRQFMSWPWSALSRRWRQPSSSSRSKTYPSKASSKKTAGSTLPTTTSSVAPENDDSLPIGLPSEVNLERKIQKLTALAEEYQALALRSSLLVTSLLFPVQGSSSVAITHDTLTNVTLPKSLPSKSSNGTTAGAMATHPNISLVHYHNKSYTDLYEYLNETGAWFTAEEKVPDDAILRTCVVEMSLDYCTRLSKQATRSWLDRRPTSLADIPDADWLRFEDDVREEITALEPFCPILEDCIDRDQWALSSCRPPTCPFRDRVACRLLTSCLTQGILEEYATALNLTLSLFDYETGTSTSAGAGKGPAAGSSGTSSTSTTAKKELTKKGPSKEKPAQISSTTKQKKGTEGGGLWGIL